VLRALVSIASVSNGDGPRGFVTQIYDMTNRAEAEDALRQSVQQFAALSELAPVGIFQTDALGRTVYVNERVCEITGRPPSDHMGDQWAAAVHPDDRERTLREWHEAARAGAEFCGEYRVVPPHGRVRWLICGARPLRGPDGLVRSFLGTITDVTELKATQEQLRESLAVRETVLAREALLLRELNHRVRNNLAGLLGLLKIYERPGKTGAEVAAAMRAMIRAMGDVHDLISRTPGGPVLLSELIARIAGGYRACLDADGPSIVVPPAQAGPLAMVFQELLTNSIKHGSLARAGGRVCITWEPEPEGVRVRWTESDGSPVQEPSHRGVGLSLVEGITGGDLRGDALFEFRPDGFSCILNLPLLQGSGSADHDRTERDRHDSHCR
jgi:PAS domain S-box-containing protein